MIKEIKMGNDLKAQLMALKVRGDGGLRDREAVVAIIPTEDDATVRVVVLEHIGKIRSMKLPRAEVPNLASALASGEFGRVDLVSLGVAPVRPPPPPPDPIGDDAIYAAKLNAVNAIRALVELTELRIASDLAK